MHGSFRRNGCRGIASGLSPQELEHIAELEHSKEHDVLQLIEGRRASVDILVGRSGLTTDEVLCHLKRAGATAWRPKELTPANWQEAGHGVYVLSLDPGDVDEVGGLVVLITPAPDVKSPVTSTLHHFEVVESRYAGTIPAIPKTTICGHVVTLDEKGRAKAQVTARVAQFPLVLGGAGICNDIVTVETNDDGFFSLTIVTGAIVNVQIPCINYSRQFVVPPPPAPGIPVRLFTL